MRAQAIMLAVFLAPAARAEPARAPLLRCAGLNEVAARISWCSQNKVALQPARECRDALLKLWKDSAAELSATLSNVNHQGYSAQNVEVANTKADLSRTHARLTELIRATDESAALISRYPLAMIEPVGMSKKPRCWTETWDELVQVVRTLDEKLAEGRRTAAEVRQLGARTGLVLANLDKDPGLAAPAVNGQPQALAAPSGASPAPASDVTGLDEDQKKRGAYLEPTPWSQKVAAQKLGEASSATAPAASPALAQAPSTITRRSGLGEKLDPLGTFSSRGSLQRESPLAVAPAAGPGASSVGAALFGSTLGLEAEMASSRSLLPSWQQEEASAAAAANLAAAPEPLSASGVKPLGEIAPAFAGNRGPASVAAAEPAAEGRTLFAQVSARYRRTEQFRAPRITAGLIR